MIGLRPSKYDFSTLASNIERRLCELGNLVTDQFPLTSREIVKAGRTVGVYFCLHGPRSVKLTAICDFDKETVLLYGEDGIRREGLGIGD